MNRTALRTLLATAAVPLAAGAALADAHTADVFAGVVLENGQNYLATDLTGTRIYAVEAGLEPNAVIPAGAAAEFDDIGEIGDLIIGADGQLQAVVVDVGGFLGLGEREVAVNWSSLVPVFEEDDPTEVFLTIAASEEEMENAPELQRVPSEAEQEAVDAALEDQPAVTPTDGAADVVVVEEDAEAVEAEGDVEVTTTEAEVISTEEAEVTLEDEAAEAEAAVEGAAAEAEAAVEGAAQEVEEGAEAAGEAVEDAAEGAADAAGDAVEATGDAIQDAGDAVEDATDEATDGN